MKQQAIIVISTIYGSAFCDVPKLCKTYRTYLILLPVRLQLATLLEQDRGKAIAIVEMVMSKERSSLHFDCICEYVGEADE